MGWLDRWDRHNQRTLEWHQHLHEEERGAASSSRRSRTRMLLLVAAAAWLVLKLSQRYVDDLLGAGSTSGILLVIWAIWAICLCLGLAEHRRRRRAWEAGRRRDGNSAAG